MKSAFTAERAIYVRHSMFQDEILLNQKFYFALPTYNHKNSSPLYFLIKRRAKLKILKAQAEKAKETAF